MAGTSDRHRQLRANKEKTFSPVRPPNGKPCDASRTGDSTPASVQGADVQNTSQQQKQTYDELIRTYREKRLKSERERKEKADARLKKETERKARAKEAREMRAAVRRDLYQACEEIRKETEFKRTRESNLVDQIRRVSETVKNGPPSEDRRPLRLQLIRLKEELSEVQMHSLARILTLKARKAEIKAKLDELKGTAEAKTAVGPPEYHVVLVGIDDLTRYTHFLRIIPNETAEEVVAVLKETLPSDVKYIITDNGPQFIAKDFEEFCQEGERILHVRIYPHHPRENGRVERHIRTVKDHLELREWNNSEELAIALDSVANELNNTPHQAIDYLTPAMFQFGCPTCEAS